jgi:LacI family transcriptional regulator
MNPSPSPFPADSRPRVALLVETSLASGRDILCGIATYARNHGPWILTHEPRSLSEGLPPWLKAWKGDGIIARVQDAAIAEGVQALGIPVVDVLGEAPRAALPLVHVDDGLVAALAAEHFLDRGFHHFAFLGIEGETWSEMRLEGFRRALPEGASLRASHLPRTLMGENPWEASLEVLAEWLAGLPRPTGILAASDQVAPLLLEACRRARVLVPDDVAVVGVDNDETLCEVCDPSLSSVEAGHRMVGYRAAELLDRLMRGEAPPAEPLRIKPSRVVVRASSEVQATSDRMVALALRIIRDRASAGLSASDLLGAVPVSRSVLQRRFRAETGRSIQQEIIHARLNHARRLLAETDLPLAEVAEASGFRHREYLSAVFREHLDTTPADYRRNALAFSPR